MTVTIIETIGDLFQMDIRSFACPDYSVHVRNGGGVGIFVNNLFHMKELNQIHLFFRVHWFSNHICLNER